MTSFAARTSGSIQGKNCPLVVAAHGGLSLEAVS
jgi:hypothetical protein